MKSIAHIRKSDDAIQTVKRHLLDAKELAESYGEKVGLKHVCGLAGLLHDVGKYTEGFRNYIWKSVYEPENAPKRGSVDHSTAGGKLLYEMFHQDAREPMRNILAEVVGNAIISHHSYLRDFINEDRCSDYLDRVKKEVKEFDFTKECFFQYVMSEDDFSEYVNQAAMEIEAFLKRGPSPSRLLFMSKYVFSAIIDADRTNTRQFEENTIEEPIDHHSLFQKYYEKLMEKNAKFKRHKRAGHPINQLRAQMSEQCEAFAARPSGIYTLSIPTGGGKTLASLRYALKHALLHNKQRIIYVVPFTTIIEQNAAEVRQILQDEMHILEHHSNVVTDDQKDDEGIEDERREAMLHQQQKLKLARDNWDSPIIFTTMVQFLNVFYAKGNRNTRRLHNLSNAVIVFDEVQKVPVRCAALFNEAVNFLKNDAHSSIVLCTATQPKLEVIRQRLEINPDGEMIEDVDEVINQFKRVQIIDYTKELMTNERLAHWIETDFQEDESTLIILNTKKAVKELYQRLKGGSLPVYHLSTSMCPAHRKKSLRKMRELLDEEVPFICVTTQLIEAGVDISFGNVIRSLAGLDSIAQAAGRCNRHGEYDEPRPVYVINHVEENVDCLKEIKAGKDIAHKMFVDLQEDPQKHGGDVLSRTAMNRYFEKYYHHEEIAEDLGYPVKQLRVRKSMISLLMGTRKKNEYVRAYQQEKGRSLPLVITGSYKTAAKHFSVIDDVTQAVIVPYDEKGKDLIVRLNSIEKVEDLTKFFREAQHYMVNIYQHNFDQLKNDDALVSYLDGQVYVLGEQWYSEEYGVDLDGDGGMKDMIC
ncbi:CRISPR-associated helicase Cas3' [Bacillus sp. FSL W7-1360]